MFGYRLKCMVREMLQTADRNCLYVSRSLYMFCLRIWSADLGKTHPFVVFVLGQITGTFKNQVDWVSDLLHLVQHNKYN